MQILSFTFPALVFFHSKQFSYRKNKQRIISNSKEHLQTSDKSIMLTATYWGPFYLAVFLQKNQHVCFLRTQTSLLLADGVDCEEKINTTVNTTDLNSERRMIALMQSNTEKLSALKLIPCTVRCFIKLPALAMMTFLHILHRARLASILLRWRHAFDLGGIF